MPTKETAVDPPRALVRQAGPHCFEFPAAALFTPYALSCRVLFGAYPVAQLDQIKAGAFRCHLESEAGDAVTPSRGRQCAVIVRVPHRPDCVWKRDLSINRAIQEGEALAGLLARLGNSLGVLVADGRGLVQCWWDRHGVYSAVPHDLAARLPVVTVADMAAPERAAAIEVDS